LELGLKGRRVLITGGSQGIGLAVAEGFLEEGCEVALVARDPERLAKVEETLSKTAPGRVRTRAIDLSRRGAPQEIADEFSDTDILINNAGGIPTGDIFDIDEDRWREAWDLKVFGYINLSRAMYRHMRGKPPKVICNVIGTGADKPMFRYVCGNAANIALNGLTQSLGGRSIDDGIRVVAVNPGAVETERWRNIHGKRAQEKFGDATRWREMLSNDLPEGRGARPDEIADVVVFLSSERASWVCGAVLPIDGGRLHRDNWF
jgi:3-oxoacyl-[acyl-carrier protein] reductase